MKNLIFYLKATIVLLVFSCSIELAAQEYLPLAYNHFDSVSVLYDEYGIKSIPCNEGVLYLGNGKVNNDAQQYSFSLIQYDAQGIKIWEKAYQFPAVNSISAVDICSPGGNYLYVAGDIIDSLNSDRFLCKLNLNGDTLFFRKYITEGYNSIIDMEYLSPDTLMILSVWKEEYDLNYSKTVIDLVDTNGIIVKTVEDSLDFKNPKDIIRHDDIIYVGGILTPHPDSLSSKVYISRYNLNLEYLGITTPSLTEREHFFGFTKSDENLLFTSRITMQTQSPYLYRTNISSVDKQGVLIDTNTFGPTDFAYYYATSTNVGNEFIATYLREDIPKIYFHSLQLDPLCNYVIDIPYTEAIFAALEEITTHSSNLISGTGHIGYHTEKGIAIKQWNFLTEDIVTFLRENCSLVGLREYMQEELKYQVIQSISNNTITIESLSNDNFGNTEIRVIDINGKLVLSKEFEKRTSFNTQNFSKGLHILQLINGRFFETHKVLVY